MRKLIYLLVFCFISGFWGCSDDEDTDVIIPPQAHLLSAARLNNDYITFNYDNLGRVVSRHVNGQPSGTITYPGTNVRVTFDDNNLTFPLNALGYAETFMDRTFTYVATGPLAGYIATMTYVGVASATENNDKEAGGYVYTFTYDVDGKCTSYTASGGDNVLNYTVQYTGSLVNKSALLNPFTGDIGMTFLGKAPGYLPTRINCSDGSYATFTYTLYASGHVKKLVNKQYNSEGELDEETVLLTHWKVGATNITGAFPIPGTVKQRVTSCIQWVGEDDQSTGTLSYNAQGFLSSIVEQRQGEAAETFIITYPSLTTIAMNGDVVGTVDASKRILTIFDDTYTYNAAGQLIKFRNEDEGIYEELYTYDEYGCITSVFSRGKDVDDLVWAWEETWEYEYENNEGVRLLNVSDCVDVARYEWWNPYFGKVSPYLPISETSPSLHYEIEYVLDENWYPTEINFYHDFGDVNQVVIEWEEK